MNIKRRLKTIAFALGLTLVGAVHAGDIYEILPCRFNAATRRYETVSSTYYTTRSDGTVGVIGAGVELLFKVRLAPRSYEMVSSDLRWKPWRLENATGLTMNELDQYRLQLAIFVGGRLEWAVNKDYQTTVDDANVSDGTLDLIFSYQTKPGDMALPILLGMKSTTGEEGPVAAHHAASGTELYLLNRDKWIITDGGEGTCDFSAFALSQYGTQLERTKAPATAALAVAPALPTRDSDITLRNCGFNVQTIDFADDWEVIDEDNPANDVWRTVREGSSTIASYKEVKLRLSAPAVQQMDVYVWSDDETVVKIPASYRGYPDIVDVRERDLSMDRAGDVKKTFVAQIRFGGGQQEARFRIYGVQQNATPCNLVLSTWKDYNYNAGGDRLQDYITVPVVCGEPERPSIRVSRGKATLLATPDETVAADTLTITRTGNYDKDIVVTLTPTFENGKDVTDDLDWRDYVRFSTMEDIDVLPSNEGALTVTIPAGSDGEAGRVVALYAYALRSDTNTRGDKNKILIKPSIDQAVKDEAGITELVETGFNINAQKPEIVAPTESSTALAVTSGEELVIPVEIRDTYADRTDAAGYTVSVKIGLTWTTLAGKFKYDDGALISTGDEKSPSIICEAAAGDQICQIRVESPVSGLKSESSFHVMVAAAKTVGVSSTDDKNDIYYEGDTVNIAIDLTEAVGRKVYAYLLSDDSELDLTQFGGGAASKAMIKSTTTDSEAKGLSVGAAVKQIKSSFTVLDGRAESEGGNNYIFSVVFCKTSTFKADQIVKGFPCTDELNITVYNKEPIIENVTLDGFEAQDETGYFGQYPKNKSLSIQPFIDDADYDLKHGFTYKWTASCNGRAVANGTVAHDKTVEKTKTEVSADGRQYTTKVPDETAINTAPFDYSFPEAGNWTVKIEVMDKDMNGRYSKVVRTISLTVIDNPSVRVEVDDSYVEGTIKNTIRVGLDYYDGKGVPMVVKLTVEPPAGANPGVLKLSDEYKTVPDSKDPLNPYAPLGDNEYYVSFEAAMTKEILIEDMDGTRLSSTKGFSVTAEVVTTGQSTDPTQQWFDYYLPGKEKVYISNVEPKVLYTEPTTATNGWTYAHVIRVSNFRDVDWDFETEWKVKNETVKGIKIEVSGDCENGNVFYATESDYALEFTPNFGSQQGPLTVTVIVSDKDSENPMEVTYYYNIPSSKYVTTVSNGPNGGVLPKLSSKYASATGRGMGHTFVESAVFQGATTHKRKWSLGRATSAIVRGYGYNVDAKDTGALNNGNNRPVNSTGDNANALATMTDAEAYAYPDEERDSFLYCWLYMVESEDSNSDADAVLGNTAVPEIRGLNNTERAIRLPGESDESGNFPMTYVEAVFSREWRPADNVGDINFDGVPDFFAFKTWQGTGELATANLIELAFGCDEENRMTSGNDLRSIADMNPDEDYLPGILDMAEDGADFVMGDRASYAPVGLPFTTRQEIRGFGEGLNAVDAGITSDPDFSETEQQAWEAFAAANGHDPAAPDLAVWSPEPGTDQFPRLDPTSDDTDGDGMPDGWEYFFWYQAHVWAPADAEQAKPCAGQQYLFERFDFGNILLGKEIPAKDVEERFNPCRTLEKDALKENPDFDGDGLSDMEELLIGTNPCHWDTDGDHMCDGWEVMMSLDPLNGSKNDNPDGDFMAYYTPSGMPLAFEGAETLISEGARIKLVFGLRFGVDYDMDGVMIRDVTRTGITFSPKFYTHTWPNGDQERLNLLYGLADDDPGEKGELLGWGYFMVENIRREEVTLLAGTQLVFENKFVFIHDQVHDAFGFDPRTAWFANEHGYVSDRWDPTINTSLSGDDLTGYAVNTRAYTTYDEYLVMKYRRDYRITYSPESDGDPEETWAAFAAKTTMPTVVLAPATGEGENTANSENTENDENTAADGEQQPAAAQPDTTAFDISEKLAAAFQKAGSDKTPRRGHGADTDGDGVPDGWELYMYRNPNAGPDEIEDGLGLPKLGDFDGDGLVYVAEYAGTDSCNAYRGCASIYANHPGNISGWFNKFFPTNPGTMKEGERIYWGIGNADGADTDADGIGDAVEGGAWDTDFYMAGTVYTPVTLGAIYGTPVDDPMSCCIRGGGMNPCTIDTDQDGLPDAWEMQHIGVPVDVATMAPVAPYGGDVDAIVEIDPLTLIADGLIRGETEDEEGATDTTTDTTTDETATESARVYLAGGMDPTWNGDPSGSAPDPLLGPDVTRDLDFDHDGLQNYQEYLVQSLRHLRWDDQVNVLMGRQMGGRDGAYTQTFVGYQEFDAARNQDDLGYFTSPARSWDRSNLSGNFMDPVYMLPVKGGMLGDAGYVSTDPRMADTDGDSMDDYYELFHGLNPILGTDPGNPTASSWSGGKKGDIISAVYMLMGLNPAYYNAYSNPWIYPSYSMIALYLNMKPCDYDPIQPPMAYDPILYPWIMGTPMADADGDGIRNYSEGIQANLANPLPTHTDPTPLWFTERTTASSYTAQYYGFSMRVLGMAAAWSPSLLPIREMTAALAGGDTSYMFGFEENEGYDTDNDMVPDSREVVTTATTSTDPLRFDDPDRRQALWLNGVDAFAMSRDRQIRAVDAPDLLKQFTAECWVRPEKEGVEQTILDRSCAYNGDAINKDRYAIRSNFRIGLRASGHVYGMFDNNDSLESGVNYPVSCQRVEGTKLPLNEWSHVALTFDGKELTIYVNGNLIQSSQTKLIPANGVTMNIQNPAATNTFPTVQYYSVPCTFYIGARARKQQLRALDATKVEAAMLYEHYQGYVDEVRVWDGARTVDEIRANYLKRFTFADVAANRDAVYAVWRPSPTGEPGGTRNENDGRPTLPPELVFHYNFQTLPGAVNAADVIKAPVGFEANVLQAAMCDYVSNPDMDTEGLYVDEDMTIKGVDASGKVAGDLLVGWWANSPLRSTVYDDYHVVPWIENTVAHLPMYDGGCLDSYLYNENTGGTYLPAQAHDIEKFVFPNSAVPYASTVYGAERALRLQNAQRFGEVYGVPYTDIFDRYRYQLRSEFVGTSDLVPMGGAFAKTCPELWDGTVADAWEYTVSDSDADGLPDWWEEYARNNYCENLDPSAPLNWDTKIVKDKLEMSASQAYLIDLALGLQPDGTINSDYAAMADSDNNGVPDWWEKLFGVQGATLLADSDNDGLSDYAEYLLSFVFKLGQIFDPRNPHSTDHNDIDYFYPIGQLYAGEIFSDGDFMEDSWELTYTDKYVNPFVWDAHSDKDEDGWSAFAECRYNNFVSTIVADKISHMLGDMEMKDFPVPTLKLTLRYNMSQMLNGGSDTNNGGNETADNQEENVLAPIIVKTYTHKGTQEDNVVPDATFTIRPGEEVDRVHYLGMWGERVARGTLTPGYVEPGSITLEMAHVAQNNSYTWSVAFGEEIVYRQGTYAEYLHDYQMYGINRVELQSEEFQWETFRDANALTVSQDGDRSQGYIRMNGERVGTIDTQTGEFAFDLTPLGRFGLEGTNAVYSLKEAVFRLAYKAKTPVLQQKKFDLFLGTPNIGAVREGKNRIVAFYDLDNNGDYTPGEPLGFAENVEVGWKQGAAEMELTDTSPVITRAALRAADTGTSGGSESSNGVSSDRYVLYGNEDGDLHDLIVGELSGGDYQRIRVVRTFFNDIPNDPNKGIVIPNRVVVDKWLHLKQRPYIFEGDVLGDGEFDLDWSTFHEIADNPNIKGRHDITNVVYRIVLGNGTVDLMATNNLFAIATNRRFDTTQNRTIPVLVSPGVGGGSVVSGSRPTFEWTMHGRNSYTAFKLQILKGSTTVWDSGMRRAPACNSLGNYTFVPDVYVGDVLEVGEKYTWRVSMYNAKFQTDAWSENSQTFEMSTTVLSGSIDMCVRYFGPASANSTVRVEAFETPDFTGDPVARTTATGSDITTFGTVHKANAKLIGLAPGTYYVRAYLDSNTYGTTNKKDAWESWGYACPRETSAQMFNPSSIVVSQEAARGQIVLVNIEDVDQNGNKVPDAWEIAQNKGTLDNGASRLGKLQTGGVIVSPALAELLEREGAKVPGGLAAQVFAAMASEPVQAMLFNVEVPEGSSVAEVITEKSEVVDGSVAITGVTLDQAAKQVVLTVEADVANDYTNTLAGSLYSFNSDTLDVYCLVYRKATLAEAGWGDPIKIEKVTVGREAAEVVVDLSDIDFSSGFFKVELKK